MTDHAFINIIQAAVARTSYEDVANRALCCVSSVKRWCEGHNLPHQFTRRGIARSLDNYRIIKETLKT